MEAYFGGMVEVIEVIEFEIYFEGNADGTNWYVEYELLVKVEARWVLNFGLSNWVNKVLLELGFLIIFCSIIIWAA